ncbi:RanGTP-binding protein-domain-containing protein [Stachybotrys elegans]|uniref:RanGTP-binding protein-domain-containing protein n=1 Tax=Stachybotrys elegans TaxID=80388 RepID=A0A8K0SQ12_9HYPO|nr:RanGTP-binding protein-domain-containing protein [Stachybotrys elegans]
MQVISPVIDLVELKSGRGNAFLAAALPLARSLHADINLLGRRAEAAASTDASSHKIAAKQPLLGIIAEIKLLLDRIDREIPLLQLAITASGESLSSSLPAGISPSRLLQASTLLIIGDTQHAQNPSRPVQIGPVFVLSLYMLFKGHASVTQPTSKHDDGNDPSKNPESKGRAPYGLGEGERKPLWQEVIHKGRVRLCRAAQTANATRYEYYLEIIQDLDDGRMHEGIENALGNPSNPCIGIQELVPVHQVSKIFYTDTGKILNIGDDPLDENSPVLLLKRDVCTQQSAGVVGQVPEATSAVSQIQAADCDDVQAEIDRQLHRESFSQGTTEAKTQSTSIPHTGFPRQLDPEWIAMEMFVEDEEILEGSDNTADYSSDDEGQPEVADPQVLQPRGNVDANFISQLRSLSLSGRPAAEVTPHCPGDGSTCNDASLEQDSRDFMDRSPFRALTSSLSLLEMLIRLAGLQEFQQTSHLAIPDHILTFFLEETSTTGIVGETHAKVRSETERRVGFDPYVPSPM